MENACIRYLRTSCLIQEQRVRKYHTKHFPCCDLVILYLLRFSSFGTFSSREAAFLLVSTKNRDLWLTSGQVQRHSGFEWICKHNRLRPGPIRFAGQTWLWTCVEWREVRESRTSRFGAGQRSARGRDFLVLTKRSGASGDESAFGTANIKLWFYSVWVQALRRGFFKCKNLV